MKKYSLAGFLFALFSPVLVFAAHFTDPLGYIYDHPIPPDFLSGPRTGRMFDQTQKPGVVGESFNSEFKGVYDVQIHNGFLYVYYIGAPSKLVKYSFNKETGDLQPEWTYTPSDTIGDWLAVPGRRIAFDSRGNVFLAGGGINKILTSNGTAVGGEQWPIVMRGSGIAVDGNDNVIVTTTTRSFVYDNAGNVLSDMLPGGPGVAADKNGVFYIRNTTSLKRFRADRTADVSWYTNGVRTYTCNQLSSDGGCAQKMLVDGQNNLYVGTYGVSKPSLVVHQSMGMLVEKYNSNGLLLWENFYPAKYFYQGGFGDTDPMDMQLDSSGNIVVMVNESFGVGRAPNTFYKIAPDGQRIWEGRYTPTTNGSGGSYAPGTFYFGMGAFALARDIDNKDMIFVGGSYGRSATDMHVMSRGDRAFLGALRIDSPPIAVAKISLDGATFGNSITVPQGATTTIFLSAEGSSDPDGWGHEKFGVSNGGKCEWNTDLDTRSASSTFEISIDNPASPAACASGPWEVKFSAAGTTTINALRITDAARVSSIANLASARLQIVVVAKPDLVVSAPPAIDTINGSPVSGVPPKEGDILTFKATVKNEGLARANSSFSNHFVIDTSNDGSAFVDIVPDLSFPNLAEGASRIANSSSWTAVKGTHRIIACADQPISLISESDETNNCNNSAGGIGGGVITVNPPNRTLTVVSIGDGSVASSGGSISNCREGDNPASGADGVCAVSVSEGTNIRLAATPDGGKVFAGWSNNCTADPLDPSNPKACVVHLDANKTVTATFNTTTQCSDNVDNDNDGETDEDDPGCTGPTDDDEDDPAATFTLTVLKAGSGSGRVTSGGGSIDCGATCTVSGVTAGTSVTLTATPSAGSSFIVWSGDCTGTNCVTTMNGNRTVTANFATNPPTSCGVLGVDGVLIGDYSRNNVVTIGEVAKTQSFSLGTSPNPADIASAGDVNGDGITDSRDVIYIGDADNDAVITNIDLFFVQRNASGAGFCKPILSPSSRPDLTITALRSTPSTIIASQRTAFAATVQNIGSVSAPASVLSFRVDINNDNHLPGGSNNDTSAIFQPPTRPVSALAAGALDTVSSTWFNPIVGTHRIIVCANSTGVFTESNESNNCTDGLGGITSSLGLVQVRDGGDINPI